MTPPTDEDGTVLPASEVARILCDSELTRIVVDAEGSPIDLGRAQRLHSAAQRRAIAVRDGGCGWPGCAAPVRWCEVHHPEWWDRDGGVTSTDNGVLLCSFHHHLVHARNLHVTRHPAVAPTHAPRSVGSRPHGPPDATTELATASPSGLHATYTFTLPNGAVLAGPRTSATDASSPGPGVGRATPELPATRSGTRGTVASGREVTGSSATAREVTGAGATGREPPEGELDLRSA